ncbi:ATP-binding cassette domain-containing protein [Reichenbachiella agarivorans]|uniref:ATP-binding cassette domain-containing protein n=1 Tax=Reichenbachiella agarivorans TaxID=2979464 RepID=A0ABY6CL68_9BACT|nr:ATP-binding cassette domain-containing protein [Reichenbachiella agarivorans]UXP31265.1 ATP-binding cassette domain-containing protein [Reichenbachiella agarivorans]
MSILQVKKLTKHFGSRTAVNAIDLQIEAGQVFGLLGPNGSGKTTTLAMLLGVLRPSAGDFTWFDQPASAESRKRIGAILETPCFYPYLTATDNLKAVAEIKGCSYNRIDITLKEVGLLDRKYDKFQTYSLGMKQRLAIASALLADPQVLILDEPTNGLDPAGIVEIREIIQKIAQTGKTIILASHLLSEVQKVCSHFAVLKAGRLLHQGSIHDIEQEKTTIEVGASNMILLRETLDQLKGIRNILQDGDFYRLEVEHEVTTEYIMQHLHAKGITPSHLLKKQGNLEQQFLKILADNE